VPDGEDPDSLIRAEGYEKFAQRIQDAQHLPDFFFEKLTIDVDINSLDGKAALSQVAMPMINQIPKGVFKELMMGELSNITNLTPEKLQSFSEAEEVLPSRIVRAPPPVIDMDGYDGIDPGEPDDDFPNFHGYEDLPADRVPLSSLAQKALQILLIQPEVCVHLTSDSLAQIKEDQGSTLLAEVLSLIMEDDIRSPVLLLARYQGSEDFEPLRRLAEKEQLLAPQDLEDEFLGTIKKLTESRQKNSKAAIRARLLSKPFSQLSQEEKDQLRTLSR
jgi:DNA primase